MSTTIYAVSGQDMDDTLTGTFYVPTKAEAVSLARANRSEGDEYASVVAMKIADMPRRELICALLNHEGFAQEQTEVPL